ncbi:MAG: PSD1 domain-containing protein [Pirellulaceae bacterium]|nr:PSD1 domain-containing protein [Pirellulaceae bacterium]
MRLAVVTSYVLGLLLPGLFLAVRSGRADEPPATATAVTYSRDIQPLLARHCLACHGPDKAEAGLRLDLAERATAPLESGVRAIVPGDAEASELLRRVAATDDAERMPPEGEPLTAEQVELLRQWIAAGAAFEQHWAYQPVREPPLPAVSHSAWVRNPIDRFVLARLEQAGVEPSPPADAATLLKRLHYDLVGLPPSPEDVLAFLNDSSPRAYEDLVDRLLDSPHFGERWGRHWLDKARYADSDGYEKDNPRPDAWRYRDWVIDAIQGDVPFDRFTIEQLAGDLLPDASPRDKLATAFHRQTLTNTEGGTDQEEFRVEATFDRTETTAAVWMGLTMTCARCHSHKYDQIPQREYYQLFAFFNNANETTTEVPTSQEALESYERQRADHAALVADAERRYAEAKKELGPQVEAWLNEQAARLAEQVSPLGFQPLKPIAATATSGATLTPQDDHSLLAAGTVPDKDTYTLVFEAPSEPLSGLRLELLADESLPAGGPGRAPNGNFVLSRVELLTSPDASTERRETMEPVELVDAEADFTQDKFSPRGVLSDEERSGWAIAPQMGKSHQLSLFAAGPVRRDGARYLHVILHQDYGGAHTIGRVRAAAITGFDPLRALPRELADAVRTPAEKRTAEQRERIADHVASLDPRAGKLAAELADLRKQAPQPPVMKVRVMTAASRPTRLLQRGDFLQPAADELRGGALAVIAHSHPLVARQPNGVPDRIDLASWLVDARHPLTARVTVNQVWAHLFGRGLVPTLNDFGVRGELPTHPELLDWLAWQFPRGMGWSRKQLIRAIVTSATYRQSSVHRADLQRIDPTNRLLGRQNRLRVEAEIVRDLHLAAAGLLSTKVGGPSVFPPLPPGVAELSYANNFKWQTSPGEDRYRRGMYTFFKRTAPHPTLISFDCPDSNTTRLGREASNTPLQALATLNNEVFTEAAQALAARVLTSGGETDRQRLEYALRLCIVRQPESDEVERFQKLLDAARGYYRAHPDDAGQLARRHAAPGIEASENAAWIATVRMVMNLDEFIVRD